MKRIDKDNIITYTFWNLDNNKFENYDIPMLLNNNSFDVRWTMHWWLFE
jgi:hypothetical protein